MYRLSCESQVHTDSHKSGVGGVEEKESKVEVIRLYQKQNIYVFIEMTTGETGVKNKNGSLRKKSSRHPILIYATNKKVAYNQNCLV